MIPLEGMLAVGTAFEDCFSVVRPDTRFPSRISSEPDDLGQGDIVEAQWVITDFVGHASSLPSQNNIPSSIASLDRRHRRNRAASLAPSAGSVASLVP